MKTSRNRIALVEVLVVTALGILLGGGSAARAQNYSLVIGLDGLGPYGLQAANTPNMHAIMDGSWASGYRGAYSLSAYAGGELGTPTEQPTYSGPGWSTINTGVWADKHGVTNNTGTFAAGNFGDYPAYLKLLEAHDGNISTSGIVAWDLIDAYIFGSRPGTSDIDYRFQDNANDVPVTNAVVSRIANLGNNDSAVFTYLYQIDRASHDHGAYSAQNLAAVATVDGQIGQMLTAITSRPDFANEDWQVMVASDHGHKRGGGHGGQTPMERTVPLIVSSKTQAPGLLTAATRAPSQIDVAATVLDYFGTPQPSYMAGQSLAQATTPTVGPSLANGLASHLAFDGNVNGSFAGSGGTITGAVSFDTGRFGQAGKVATYRTGHVTLNDDIAAAWGTSTDFALSLWIKYDQVIDNPAFFANKSWQSGNNTGISLAQQNASGNTDGLDVNLKAAGGTRYDIEPYRGFEADTWHHVLLNVDRDGLTLLYIDGALFGTNYTSAGSFDGAYNFTFFNDGTGGFDFGASATNLMIDEFGAWNRLLTADEIAFLSVNPLSAALVPEPGCLILFGLGACGVLALHRRRQRA